MSGTNIETMRRVYESATGGIDTSRYTSTGLTDFRTQSCDMKMPAELEEVAGKQKGVIMSEREYDEDSVIAVDFGPLSGDPSVDIVEGTAVVVIDGKQLEFDLPAGANDITVNGGVLTIRG